jgi:Domain of unknown function (DUF3127)
MALELTGKLIQVMPEQSGTGKAGPWTKQEFILETQDQYPRKVCFNFWNEKAGILKTLQEGDLVKVSFNAESRDYNGRWYTDLKAWKLENLGKTTEEQKTKAVGKSKEENEESSAFTQAPDADDLPF